MDADLKTKWVDALHSGDYLQGQHTLRRNNRFCCLGVLADIDGCTWEQFSFDDNVFVAKDTRGVKHLSTYFPEGFSYEHGQVLVRMNDNGSTFQEIADYIEREL